MRLQRFTQYLLTHRPQALFLTFALSFIPVVGVFGIVFAAFVTLTRGALEGAIFLIAATLADPILFYVSGSDATLSVLAIWIGVGAATLSNVLTWVFALMLRRHTSWSAMAQIAALASVFVISLVHLADPNIAAWWASQLTQMHILANASHLSLTEEQVDFINSTKQFATGSIIAAIVVSALLKLSIARWWQAAVYHRGALRRELHNIRLSRLAGILFAFGLVMDYLGNGVVVDIMPVVYLLFAAAGLSLVHYFFRLMRSSSVWLWLSIFYATLFLTFAVSIKFLALLGFMDIWLDLRKRSKVKGF